MLTTSHFLLRPYRIPNQEESQDFKDFITNNEARILKDLLGIDFYNAFVAGLAEAVVADKWTKLKLGTEYDYTGITYKYEGMFDLLIPMVYSLWLMETFDRHTSAGIVVATPAESEVISPSRRIGKANAEFFRKAGDECHHENTLYGFLYANRETYTEWDSTQWCPRGRVNILGL
jgi:hypothetical protein